MVAPACLRQIFERQLTLAAAVSSVNIAASDAIFWLTMASNDTGDVLSEICECHTG